MKHKSLIKFFIVIGLALGAQHTAIAQQERVCMATSPDTLPSGTSGLLRATVSQATTLENPAAPASGSVIIIPVVVHVVYNTSAQQISNQQVRSQIQVLNQDFRKKNTDTRYIPAAFRALAGDARIEFRLATKDPAGLPTSGITRTPTEAPVFGLDDAIKDPAAGGVGAWNRDEYLNIWVGNLSPGIMGYASVPGCSPEKDGVVVRHDAFGTTGTVKSPHHKGRTTVHEIGHWLGLRHIWGDAACGDDQVDDTPPQQGPTRGCPSGVVATCSSGPAGNMYMNFMDFTNDECINMFTAGQVARMRALFSAGEARHALLFSEKAAGAVVDMETSYTPEWQVYPNPATQELWIRQPGQLSGSLSAGSPDNSTLDYLSGDLSGIQPDKPAAATGRVVIFNSLGQPVKQLQLQAGQTRVDIRGLNPGIYYISGTDGLKLKFMKVK